MFEQHPVPQQISSYQFRLVGDMTLKQFFQLAGGAVLGLLVYASPLPSIFKWPIIIVFVLGGAAFAFLPLQERPLSEWIVAFFRSIYGPTIFTWNTPSPDSIYFAPEAGSEPQASPTAIITDPHTSKLEEAEKSMLTKVTSLFTLPSRPKDTSAPISATPTGVVSTPPVQVLQPVPPGQILSELKDEAIIPTSPPPMPHMPAQTPQVAPVAVTNKQGYDAPNQGAVGKTESPVPAPAAVSQTLTPNMVQANAAQFSADAAPPTPATQPNIVVGQVMDSAGKIVTGAIMEIKDQVGRPVRALKTNQAGHFMIVTPLANGTYKIFTEKEGLVFEPVSVEMTGSILQPIAVRAKSA